VNDRQKRAPGKKSSVCEIKDLEKGMMRNRKKVWILRLGP